MSNNTFEKWQDALPYIGKQVGVRVVESPDIKGMLTGFDFTLNDKTEEVDKVYLKLADHHAKFEFWECYPVTDKYKVYTPIENTNELAPFKGGILWEQGVVYAPYIPVATAINVNGEIVGYRNNWKNLWLKFKRLFYKSKNYKDHMKYMNRKVDPKLYGTIKIAKDK